MTHKHFGSSGDLGDIIFSMPLVQQLGGKHFYWFYNRPFTKDIESRFDLIAPLLMVQDYIECVGISNGNEVDYDLSQFRKHYLPTRTLLESQAEWATRTYGLPAPRGDRQWLYAPPEAGLRQRVVVARSPRYHNPYFPWKQIVRHYGDTILFVGLREEHAAFCEAFGNVEHRKTRDLLETASVIAGSGLFIGNQSSPNALAEGLKHPRIQETNLRVPDCIYPGSENAQHVADGKVFLPAVGDKAALQIEAPFPRFREFDIVTTPPGNWQYLDGLKSPSFSALRAEVRKVHNMTVEQANEAIYTYNCERVPDFFRANSHEGLLATVLRAKQNAL